MAVITIAAIAALNMQAMLRRLLLGAWEQRRSLSDLNGYREVRMHSGSAGMMAEFKSDHASVDWWKFQLAPGMVAHSGPD